MALLRKNFQSVFVTTTYCIVATFRFEIVFKGYKNVGLTVWPRQRVMI
jgi:hypothetical protein